LTKRTRGRRPPTTSRPSPVTLTLGGAGLWAAPKRAHREPILYTEDLRGRRNDNEPQPCERLRAAQRPEPGLCGVRARTAWRGGPRLAWLFPPGKSPRQKVLVLVPSFSYLGLAETVGRR